MGCGGIGVCYDTALRISRWGWGMGCHFRGHGVSGYLMRRFVLRLINTLCGSKAGGMQD